jgi:uncharacterized protein YdeI (YjbR/CyaY-like superfamily)
MKFTSGLRIEPKTTSDFLVPEELSERFRTDPRFMRAFEQSATRTARIEKAMPAIFEGRGFVERR